jgi:hypothetical protein
MSGVFRNIDPPPTNPRRVCTHPPLVMGGGHTRWVERGWGVNSSERRQTLICTLYMLVLYFVPPTLFSAKNSTEDWYTSTTFFAKGTNAVTLESNERF